MSAVSREHIRLADLAVGEDWDRVVGDNEECLLNVVAKAIADAEERGRAFTQREWIAVSEWLPDPGELVLVVNHEGDYVVVVLERSNGEPYWAAVDGDLPLCNYPHWMALPAMPKAGG